MQYGGIFFYFQIIHFALLKSIESKEGSFYTILYSLYLFTVSIRFLH